MKHPRLALVPPRTPDSDATGPATANRSSAARRGLPAETRRHAPRHRRYVVLLPSEAAARLEALASDACREPEQQLEFYARRGLDEDGRVSLG